MCVWLVSCLLCSYCLYVYTLFFCTASEYDNVTNINLHLILWVNTFINLLSKRRKTPCQLPAEDKLHESYYSV